MFSVFSNVIINVVYHKNTLFELLSLSIVHVLLI